MAGKALITGGAGFIGSHLSELLLANGWEVFVLDDVSTGQLDNIEHLRSRSDYHLVVDSILSPAVVSEVVHKCDVVFHLAAAVGVRLIVEQPVHTMVTNVQGTETVLEYCSKFGKRVLVASSSEVYGDHREERPLAEDDRRIYGPTTEKRWLYADSKAMDEHLALSYHLERGLDTVVVRLFNTVGPRQSGRYGMVIPRFVESALAGDPIEVHGDGTQTRSFCHVADTIRALAGLMDARELSGEIFNVGSSERVRIVDLAERVKAGHRERLGDRVRPVRPGLRPGHRGHAPPRARDREDPRGDRLEPRAEPRRHPRRRDRRAPGSGHGVDL